jgi:hypothetical protein
VALTFLEWHRSLLSNKKQGKQQPRPKAKRNAISRRTGAARDTKYELRARDMETAAYSFDCSLRKFITRGERGEGARGRCEGKGEGTGEGESARRGRGERDGGKGPSKG